MTIETFNADAATKEEITDELVIALFIEDITNVVTNFYSEYYGLGFLEKKFRIL